MDHSHKTICACDHKGGVCTCNHDDDSLKARIKPYSRLIVTLSIVIIFGIVLSFVNGFSWLTLMDYWMGGYFLAFGIMQAWSLKKSAAMLRGYDPLAKLFVPYGFAYPFIQVGLGLAYFFMIWPITVSAIASIVLLINTIGVERVIRNKEVVRCGCLGDGMNVPVSRVTLTENTIMFGMTVFMLALHILMYLIGLTTGGDVDLMPGMKM